MASSSELIQSLWKEFDFSPNAQQKDAILHVKGPLFLPAGPGSGKTRVLLWRTINLIVSYGVAPEEIFLSTFTEKAALQLKNGLRTLLGAVSEKNGHPYDTAKLYVGTVHSLCQRILLDRRFSADRRRTKPPIMLDELEQLMFLRRQSHWKAVTDAMGLSGSDINATFDDVGISKIKAISHLLSFFNRLSEEMIDPHVARNRTKDKDLRALLDGYKVYLELLRDQRGLRFTDLSLVQQATAELLRQFPESSRVFRHVIIDEYQDTNPVQEQIFFKLAHGHRNICVVGDDDQALYRFRGATVENFVEFPERCKEHLSVSPKPIVLSTNYRSRGDIVKFYNRFIVHSSCDWKRKKSGFFRVMDKKITANRSEKAVSVVASNPDSPEAVAAEIAQLVRHLIDSKKVTDPNQIAFLFPSLKYRGQIKPQVARMQDALSKVGIAVYCPRGGNFLDVQEAVGVFGLIFHILGKLDHRHTQFQEWFTKVYGDSQKLINADPFLRRFIEEKKREIQQVSDDHGALEKISGKKGWAVKDAYDPEQMPGALASAPGLSEKARRSILSGLFARFARERIRGGKPFTVGYAITRASSLDWNVLDLLYQLCGFRHFKTMFDIAENATDEGPICNLALISRYLARFLDNYPFPISGENLANGQFLRIFSNYLYVLFRRGESEYENAEDPFPKGRVPFITIHQAKGLEFPVVVLGNLRKDPTLQKIEEMVAPLVKRKGEPLDRMPLFDVMRLFYVALSRAKNLLILAHYKGQGQKLNDPFKDFLDTDFPRISQLKISTVPAAKLEEQDIPQSYSYTGDFLLYGKCPRQYMVFRKYGFVPSRSQTMFFGSLVHQTLEDLHQHLISNRRSVS